ncbi:MAG TPA: response regulator [Allosphingosinicella sp.]|uniref:response regulator transcription factor n=1 Tax=Allosphingosinicella sp. TaxID=2823234 RepID=UPI002EDA16CE
MIHSAINRGVPGRVLVVDDVEDNRVILSRNLARAGFETECVEDGVQAISRVSTDPPDLILLDWMMPGLSGIDVLTAIREHYDANQLPIIMCTARDEGSSIVTALNAGANDYIQKPLNFSIVTARVTAQLERKNALTALAEINRDLEDELAHRTRALMARQSEQDDNVRQDCSAALSDILRWTAWLKTDEAQTDARLREVCLDSIVAAARKLATL